MKLKIYLKNRWQILACIRPLWIVTNVTLRTIQQKTAQYEKLHNFAPKTSKKTRSP